MKLLFKLLKNYLLLKLKRSIFWAMIHVQLFLSWSIIFRGCELALSPCLSTKNVHWTGQVSGIHVRRNQNKTPSQVRWRISITHDSSVKEAKTTEPNYTINYYLWGWNNYQPFSLVGNVYLFKPSNVITKIVDQLRIVLI